MPFSDSNAFSSSTKAAAAAADSHAAATLVRSTPEAQRSHPSTFVEGVPFCLQVCCRVAAWALGFACSIISWYSPSSFNVYMPSVAPSSVAGDDVPASQTGLHSHNPASSPQGGTRAKTEHSIVR